MEKEIKTPCVKVCKVQLGACVGCGRTIEQIRNWAIYSEHKREAIMRQLWLSQNANSTPTSKDTKPSSKAD